MQVSASIRNSFHNNHVIVSTNGAEKSIVVESKTEGYGSSINGGEFLFLSIATCFCNDVYREAAKRQMKVELVEVIVNGEFGKEGEPGFNISYTAKVEAPGYSAEEINDLIGYVDRIAEIHNTLRKGVKVELA